jgi:hypothetical protein
VMMHKNWPDAAGTLVGSSAAQVEMWPKATGSKPVRG